MKLFIIDVQLSKLKLLSKTFNFFFITKQNTLINQKLYLIETNNLNTRIFKFITLKRNKSLFLFNFITIFENKQLQTTKYYKLTINNFILLFFVFQITQKTIAKKVIYFYFIKFKFVII